MNISKIMGGYGGMNNQINKIIKDLNDVNNIVRDIFKKLDDFKKATDKAIAKETVKKAEERIGELKGKVQRMAPRFNQTLSKIEQQIDDLKKHLQMPI